MSELENSFKPYDSDNPSYDSDKLCKGQQENSKLQWKPIKECSPDEGVVYIKERIFSKYYSYFTLPVSKWHNQEFEEWKNKHSECEWIPHIDLVRLIERNS